MFSEELHWSTQLSSAFLCFRIGRGVMGVVFFLPMQFYDIRMKCEGNYCYDFSPVDRLMNEDSVKEAIGVGDVEFSTCSANVLIHMLNYIMRNLEVVIPALLEDGIRALVYSGEYDIICNWIGMVSSQSRCSSGTRLNHPQIAMAETQNFKQGAPGGSTQYNGKVRRALQRPPLFHSWLMVRKQGFSTAMVHFLS